MIVCVFVVLDLFGFYFDFEVVVWFVEIVEVVVFWFYCMFCGDVVLGCLCGWCCVFNCICWIKMIGYWLLG